MLTHKAANRWDDAFFALMIRVMNDNDPSQAEAFHDDCAIEELMMEFRNMQGTRALLDRIESVLIKLKGMHVQ